MINKPFTIVDYHHTAKSVLNSLGYEDRMQIDDGVSLFSVVDKLLTAGLNVMIVQPKTSDYNVITVTTFGSFHTR